ncbi:MAG: hypothetical protein L0K92_07915, partial [Enterobacterales bacterium]|nr:hypothetical protein [Enterobacterales bacterium]
MKNLIRAVLPALLLSPLSLFCSANAYAQSAVIQQQQQMIQQQQQGFQNQNNSFNQQQLRNTQTQIQRDNQAQQIHQLNENMR